LAYEKTNWVDRLVEHPNRFTLTDNGDGTYTLTPQPGTVTQTGTPLSASKMNKIEQWLETSVQKGGLVSDMTDANVLTEEGHYNVGATWTGSPHSGMNGSNQGYLQHYQWHNSAGLYCLQVFNQVNGDGKRYWRIKDDGVWGDWREDISSAGGTIEETLSLSRTGAQLKLSGANLDGALFTSDDYIYLTDWATVTKGMRIDMTNGWTEVNDGTGWRPVGGIKRVQRGSVSVSASGGVNVTISSVDLNKTWVNVNTSKTIVTGGTDWADGSGGATYELTSETNLKITPTNSFAYGTYHYEIVESY
jgi:hypothetical protein